MVNNETNYAMDGMDINDWYSWQISLEESVELVNTKTGGIYPFTSRDIENMVTKIKLLLEDIIHPDCTVSMFLPLGESQFLPMLLYNTFVECGAMVFRYGTRNLERQIKLFDVTKTDIIIASPALWSCIKSFYQDIENLTWIAYIPLKRNEDNIENQIISRPDRFLIEHDTVPAFFIQNKNGLFSCPGYICDISEDLIKDSKGNVTKELIISTDDIEGFHLKNFKTGLDVEIQKDLLSKEEILFFIKDIVNDDKISLYSRILNLLQSYQISYSDGYLELDSLSIVELLVILEDEFSFTVEVDEINRSDFDTIDRLVSFVKKKLESQVK